MIKMYDLMIEKCQSEKQMKLLYSYLIYSILFKYGKLSSFLSRDIHPIHCAKFK